MSTVCTVESRATLESCLASLLESLGTEQPIPIHFQLFYEQAIPQAQFQQQDKTFTFASASTSLAFDDATLGPVKEAWKLVVGSVNEDDEADYLKFPDREGAGEDDGAYD